MVLCCLMRRALLVLAVPALLGALATGTAGTATRSAASTAGPLSRSAHVAYEGCPAADVVLTVTLPYRTFAPGQLVTYQVRLHNLGGRACGPSDGATPSASPVGTLLGACSALPVDIENAQGRNVFPGSEAVACPALLGPRLPARGNVTATGTWDQRQGAGRPALRAVPAPRGTYHLVVDDEVRLPIVLS